LIKNRKWFIIHWVMQDPDSVKSKTESGDVDFDTWFAGDKSEGEGATPAVEAMELPPPLKDATVVDEVISCPTMPFQAFQ
jgi:hypothetical protein